ncbi:hypothetical protein BT93_H1695 [Corymbia citriodora subsp. variegata]|nr:hypothetical protein BT93_H1695 [Corymbia citriodora subsp. variegata]
MVEGMSPTVTLIYLIANGMLIFYSIFIFVLGVIESVLLAIMFDEMRPTVICICRLAASTHLLSLFPVFTALALLTLWLAETGTSATVLCICLIAIIITLLFLSILLALVLTEYNDRLRLWLQISVRQMRHTRVLEERKKERKQFLQELFEVFPSVSYTSQGIGSRFRDCAICLDDFAEDELCWIIPSCKHVFHSTCIDRWLMTRLCCPLCRKPILCRNRLVYY